MRVLISIAVLVSTAHGADFTTYIAAAQNPYPSQSAIGALTTDAEGNTYVTGGNAFVAKLDPTGNIVFTTTLGQDGPYSYSYGFSIALDPSGNIWVGGQTGVNNGTGLLVKMSPQGTVLYSSYFVRGRPGQQQCKRHRDGPRRQCLRDWLD
jgi:hypothetical protein